MTIEKRKLGWKPDIPDPRDIKYEKTKLKAEKPEKLPVKIDLRSKFPVGPFEQGDMGTCVANALAAALMFDRQKQGLAKFMPSRLYIYYNARVLDGTVEKDDGTTIRTALKGIAKHGFAHESLWGYDESLLTRKPPESVYKDGKRHYTTVYYSVDSTSLTSLRSCLASGYPIIIGFNMYDSFYDANMLGGYVKLPNDDSRLEGGHCVLIVGYDDESRQFLIRNSWGSDVGDGTGHFFMPYEYLTDKRYADDFWTVREVSSDSLDKPLI